MKRISGRRSSKYKVLELEECLTSLRKSKEPSVVKSWQARRKKVVGDEVQKRLGARSCGHSKNTNFYSKLKVNALKAFEQNFRDLPGSLWAATLRVECREMGEEIGRPFRR